MLGSLMLIDGDCGWLEPADEALLGPAAALAACLSMSETEVIRFLEMSSNVFSISESFSSVATLN